MSAAAPSPSLRRRLSTLRYRAVAWAWSRSKSLVGARPGLFYPLHRLLVSPDWTKLETAPGCDLVIEGAQRSATSYAVAAVQVANPGGLRIAHHLHVAAQIRQAVRFGLPALVLIREPEAAVRSLLIYDPHLDAASALRAYRAFYAGCLPYVDDFVAAAFEEATGNMAGVIARINARFGTAFVPYRGSQEEVSRIEAILERNNRERDSGNPFTSYLPNPVKEAAKRRIDLAGHKRLLADCRALYEDYLQLAARRER